MVKRTAIYPGTFDPITNGHLDIIARAVKMVDHLIIGVAINEAKGPLFTLDERVEMVRQEVAEFAKLGAEISVRPYDNLLMHFAEEVDAQMIIRGLRAVSDFEYEFQMVSMNMQLNREIEMVFLMAGAEHQAIASRLVKEIASLGGDVSHFTSPRIVKRLLAKLSSNGIKFSPRRPKVVALKGGDAKPRSKS
jgi:pantetheine-phosphate adenylyltransferase